MQSLLLRRPRPRPVGRLGRRRHARIRARRPDPTSAPPSTGDKQEALFSGRPPPWRRPGFGPADLEPWVPRSQAFCASSRSVRPSSAARVAQGIAHGQAHYRRRVRRPPPSATAQRRPPRPATHRHMPSTATRSRTDLGHQGLGPWATRAGCPGDSDAPRPRSHTVQTAAGHDPPPGRRSAVETREAKARAHSSHRLRGRMPRVLPPAVAGRKAAWAFERTRGRGRPCFFCGKIQGETGCG